MSLSPRTALAQSPRSPSSPSLNHQERFGFGSWLSSVFCSRRRLGRILSILFFSLTIFVWISMSFVHPTHTLTPTNNSSEYVIEEPESVEPTMHINDIIYPSFKDVNGDYTRWIRNTVTPLSHSFLHGLRTYTQQGHSYSELADLTPSLPLHPPSITAVIRDNPDIANQINAVQAQSLAVKDILVISSSSSTPFLKSNKDSSVRIVNIDSASSNSHAYWIQVAQTTLSDFVWILDGGTVPGKNYLQYIWSVGQTTEYRNALLGTHGMLLPANANEDPAADIFCLPESFGALPPVAQPVDAIHGAWLMPRAWLRHLTDMPSHALAAPISFYISQSLAYHASIPSVVVPAPEDGNYQLKMKTGCKQLEKDYRNDKGWKAWLELHSTPTALDYRQTAFMQPTTVLFVADGPQQAIGLHPLYCRYKSTVHIAVTGSERGLSGKALQSALKDMDCPNVMIHDLAVGHPFDSLKAATTAALGIAQLVDALQPAAIIHVKDHKPLTAVVDTLARMHNITAICLPIKDIPHAVWISHLSKEALQRWNDVEVDLVVITDRRPHSLSRLLQSTSKAHYLGDVVNIKIHLEQSADRVTRMLVNGFSWEHGEKTVRHRIQKGGLMPAIVESWYPSSNDNYAVLLEDDIEVSPFFYAWVKYNILKYRYSQESDDAMLMYGISLYSPRHLELLPQGRRPFDPIVSIGPEYSPRTPYLSQVPCSWGAVYFPEHWREFHSYLTSRMEDIRQDQLMNITVPNSRSSRWTKSWKKYFIELVYLRSYVMLYPNFQLFESFSTNHLEFGTHVKKGRDDALDEFLVPLMKRDTILNQLPQRRLPTFEDLPVLDLWGNLVTRQELDARGAELHQNVSACPRQTGRFDPQDILCPLHPEKKEKKKSSAKAVAAANPPAPQKTVTVYTDPIIEDTIVINDEFYPIAIDVSQMVSPESDHEHEDEELADLEHDLEKLKALYNDIDTR